MKTKIIAALVAVAMSITLAACGTNTPVNNSADNAASNTALKATQPETDTQVIAENETEIVTETVTEKVTNAQGKAEIVTKTVKKAVPKMTVNADGKTVPVTKKAVAANTKSNSKNTAKTVNTTVKATVAKATTKKPAQTVAKTAAKPATTKHTHTWKKVQTNEGEIVRVQYDTIVSYETSGDGFRMYGKTISMNPMTVQCIWVKIDRVLQDGWEGTVWVQQPDGKFYCAEKNKTITKDNGKTQYKGEPAEPVYADWCASCHTIRCRKCGNSISWYFALGRCDKCDMDFKIDNSVQRKLLKEAQAYGYEG